MSHSASKPIFTAELRRQHGATIDFTNGTGDWSSANASADGNHGPHLARRERHADTVDILNAIEELRKIMVSGQAATGLESSASIKSSRRESASAMTVDSPQSSSTQSAADTAEANALIEVVRELQESIVKTRQEIAALRCKGTPPKDLRAASDELDAVVDATETATECILSAAERMDESIGRIRNQLSDAEDLLILDDMAEQVVKIFENCNFQDITGQRITKVVNTMKFVEDRVDRMVDILGGYAAIEEVSPPSDVLAEQDLSEEAKLLHGPQLDVPTKISQDDVDKFFS